MNITRVVPVAPFKVCFKAETVAIDAYGPIVPVIDFVLHKNSVKWRIYGANSMVKVSKCMWCLGFVDGGKETSTSIVIGGKQMEDYMVEFDLQSSKLGLSSPLLRIGTSCSTFKGI
ncbi:Basic 7S globulin [Bienertia sinuspersici]